MFNIDDFVYGITESHRRQSIYYFQITGIQKKYNQLHYFDKHQIEYFFVSKNKDEVIEKVLSNVNQRKSIIKQDFKKSCSDNFKRYKLDLERLNIAEQNVKKFIENNEHHSLTLEF